MKKPLVRIRTVETYNEVIHQMTNCAAFINSSYNFEACKEVMNEFIICEIRLMECEDYFELDENGFATQFIGAK